MLDPILTLSPQQIRDRLDLLQNMNLYNTIYEPNRGYMLRIGYDPNNQYHATLYVLLDEMGHRVNNVKHHLGWAEEFNEGPGSPNTLAAAAALLQAEALAQTVLTLLTTATPATSVI